MKFKQQPKNTLYAQLVICCFPNNSSSINKALANKSVL